MALKNKNLKKSLEVTAKENTSATIKNKDGQNTLKQGVPNDHSVKHLGDTPIVGISIGTTINMDNYESLRVDCWLTDKVHTEETTEQAYDRIIKIAQDTLQSVVNEFTGDD